jgi:hypothetical protein
MLRHRHLAHVGLKAFQILPKVVADALTMTGKCDCESCIQCKLTRTPFTPTTSRATEPLKLVHSNICGSLETANAGGRYMLLFIDATTRHMDEYIFKYSSEALGKFK